MSKLVRDPWLRSLHTSQVDFVYRGIQTDSNTIVVEARFRYI